MKIIVGLDLSLNSAGIVALDGGGDVIFSKYITAIKKYIDVHSYMEIKGFQTSSSVECKYLPPKVTQTKKRVAEDGLNFTARRRNLVSTEVIQALVRAGKCGDVLVCLEGYAIDSKSTGLLEMAEISGIVRNYCWKENIPLRVHDPLSVKIWGCGNAHAKKMHMVNAARRANLFIDQALLGKGNKFVFPMDIDGDLHTHDYGGPGTDIADAFHLAEMGRHEVLVQSNLLRLDQLTEQQRKVFLRTTKANPVNLLGRPFILKVEEDTLV
jgi:hypothetical protein